MPNPSNRNNEPRDSRQLFISPVALCNWAVFIKRGNAVKESAPRTWVYPRGLAASALLAIQRAVVGKLHDEVEHRRVAQQPPSPRDKPVDGKLSNATPRTIFAAGSGNLKFEI